MNNYEQIRAYTYCIAGNIILHHGANAELNARQNFAHHQQLNVPTWFNCASWIFAFSASIPFLIVFVICMLSHLTFLESSIFASIVGLITGIAIVFLSLNDIYNDIQSAKLQNDLQRQLSLLNQEDREEVFVFLRNQGLAQSKMNQKYNKGYNDGFIDGMYMD